jgi:uncharacterized repeat protein (TIGR03843 family)
VPADERPPRSPELTDGQWLALLEEGEAEVEGRLPWSSNATFLVTVRRGDRSGRAVYKPGRGERGLWDFPGGLYRREVAAFELDRALGLGVIPATVLRRDAPFGEGSLQRFIEADFSEHYFSLREEAVHLDALRVIAAFDLLANNADRKGGHCLHDLANGVILGIDHGLTFHRAWKLRTVIWDFADEPVPPALAEDVCRVSADVFSGPLAERIDGLLAPQELAALSVRAGDLGREARFPAPEPGYHSVPWPLV